jgi:MFS family permease
VFLLGRTTAVAAAAFAVVYGLPMGGIAALQPVLVAEYFGPAAFGPVYGTLVLLLTLGAAAGPLIAGRVYDLGGGYEPTLVACIVASAGAAVLMATVKRPGVPARRVLTTIES